MFGICAFDDINERVLDGYFEANNNMSIQMCLDICRSKGFRYAGLQWQSECHCGTEPAIGFKWAWPSKCNDVCSGDSNQICGGSEALSIWSTPPQILEGLCVYDFPSNKRVLSDFSMTGSRNLTKEICASICSGKKPMSSNNLMR